ncbi:hypothetical protein OCV88_14480 [Brotonthovivens ammoniilytica]|uniref:Uncharacterized protein n=1 Tax=Brotonthovivens ammoniilytica TaxID=2981725 RepID=A0ABT2TMR7_9FIRM|nr:hypothetical protein [Brotonthovivens ammoniilytica]MCU6763519.1 hypothetical protein [Brotonthovivens ammoniilytica]
MVIDVDVYVLDNKLKETIDYVQGTNALGISFHFLDYDIPSGASAKVYAAKPSTKAVYNTAAISGNDVNVDVTDQMFSEVGLTKLQVQIVKGADTLVTFVQLVRVHKNYVAGDVPESDNESNFIDDYLDDIKDATSKANTATDKANTAAGRAEDALEAIEGAVKGTLINDETSSKVTVYSGDKVEHLANLFSFNNLHDSNTSHIVDGNKITITSKTTGKSCLVYKDIQLKKGYYTIAWQSTRSGNSGGGIYVDLRYSDGTTEAGTNGYSGLLNTFATFHMKENATARIMMYSGLTTGAVSGDTATFEVFLVEGVYDFSQERPMLNSVKDVTELLLDERTNAANLFDMNKISDGETGTVKISDGKIIVTSEAVTAAQGGIVNIKDMIKSNTWYTLTWSSTRSGGYGGGVLIDYNDGTGNKRIAEKPNELNGSLIFFSGESDKAKSFRIALLSGITDKSKVGDTATFEDVLLMEGTQYAPANLHNVKDLAQLTAAVDNRSAINLFDYKGANGITFIRATGSVSENKITVKSTDNSNYAYASYRTKDLKPNTNYTISAKSTRTGTTGGGIRCTLMTGTTAVSLGNARNCLNPVVAFNTKDIDKADFLLISFEASDISTVGGVVGESATFTDIMLVEGDFAPGSYVPSIGADNFSQAIADLQAQIVVLEAVILNNI